ncbi:hypothetical protein EIP86_002538 [Pleurotus ostreatoroseus]|nr:hypothetical protein EIP86_002538 [Pleurotus ostreatoroseus]
MAVLVNAIAWDKQDISYRVALGVLLIVTGSVVRGSARKTIGVYTDAVPVPKFATSTCPTHGKTNYEEPFFLFDIHPKILADIPINQGVTCRCYFEDEHWSRTRDRELVEWLLLGPDNNIVAERGYHLLVQSGLYQYIRHPMYLGAILALVGSWVIATASESPTYLWMHHSFLSTPLFTSEPLHTLPPESWELFGSTLDTLLKELTWTAVLEDLHDFSLLGGIMGYIRVAKTEEKALNWEFGEKWGQYCRSVHILELRLTRAISCKMEANQKAFWSSYYALQ